MTNTARNMALAAIAGAMLTAPRVVSGADMPAALDAAHSHVRSEDAAVRVLIQQATDRSATFRWLVETISARDGIVYVEAASCGHGVRACLHTVSSPGGHRMLFVKVDLRKGVDSNLMGSIGHELRHAIEVLDDPTVVNNATMFFLYERIGYHGTGSGAVETSAAVDAGNIVREEVRSFDRRKKAE